MGNLSKVLLSGVAVVLIGMGVYYGYTAYQASRSQTSTIIQAPDVSVFTVENKAIYPEVSFVAKIESQDTVGLRARVTGFLQERLFNEGDVVEAGQPLFIIEKVNFEAKVREAEANV